MSTRAPPSFRPPPNASERGQLRWKRDMQHWLSDQLDEQDIRQVGLANANPPGVERLCIASARAGHPEALRKLYPQFADCIHSPKLRRGQKYWKQPKDAPAKIAADFAKRIRAIWSKQYGKRNRAKNEISAEEFAVEICKEWLGTKAAGLSVDETLAAAKPSGKRKPRRK